MRLIDADALLEKLEKEDIYYDKSTVLITNAPAIEQGEPVAYIVELSNAATRVLEFELPKHGWEFLGNNAAKITPLYTSPPQPQTVKDALEKAAKICDDRAKYMKEMIMQDVVVGKADTGAMVCANAIRALIEKE